MGSPRESKDTDLLSNYTEPPPYSVRDDANEQTPLLGSGSGGSQGPSFIPSHSSPKRLKVKDNTQTKPKPSVLRGIFVIAGTFITACLLLSACYGIPGFEVRLPEPVKVVKVAVIGAGPAGTAAAFAIGREFDAEVGRNSLKGRGWGRSWRSQRKVDVQVTVFERNSRVGGRMMLDFSANATFAGTGMGVFGSKQFRMEYLAASPLLGEGSLLRSRAERELGTDFDTQPKGGKKIVAFFDSEAKDVKARLPRPVSELSWGAYMSLLFNYGASLWRVKKIASKPMGGFERFKGLKTSFRSMAEMVHAAELEEMVRRSGMEGMENNGVGGRYHNEILTPQLRRQLGQEVQEISELSLGIALAREDQPVAISGMRAEDVLEQLLKRSGAKLALNTEVLDLERGAVYAGLGPERWIVKTNGSEGVGDKDFDHVVIATPLSSLKSREMLGIGEDVLSYRSVFITLLSVDGHLSPEIFKGADDADEVLPIPLTDTGDLSSPLKNILEISHVRDAYGPDLSSSVSSPSSYSVPKNDDSATTQAIHSLYRILSTHPLSISTLSKLLETNGTTIQEVHEQKIEQAWPLLWPRTLEELEELGSFEVKTEGLWWTGSYEGVLYGVDAAWTVGELVGKTVAERLLKKAGHS
jgi:hypothetical protein